MSRAVSLEKRIWRGNDFCEAYLCLGPPISLALDERKVGVYRDRVISPSRNAALDEKKKIILINLMLFTRAWSDRRSDRDLSSLTHDRSGRTCVNGRVKFIRYIDLI